MNDPIDHPVSGQSTRNRLQRNMDGFWINKNSARGTETGTGLTKIDVLTVRSPRVMVLMCWWENGFHHTSGGEVGGVGRVGGVGGFHQLCQMIKRFFCDLDTPSPLFVILSHNSRKFRPTTTLPLMSYD
jgi:hypothetical protein